MQQTASDPETAEQQRRIIETVDRFEKWLRELQQSVSPVTLSLQRISVARLIADVAKVLQPMADRLGVSIVSDVDISLGDVRADNHHMEQALVALLTNAIQASKAGKVVRVSAKRAAAGSSEWCLAVADQGPGIPPAIRDKIFLPYFTTKPDGSGVGLSTANKVVTAHGGRLTVESEPGCGSVFVATMPDLTQEER
jgi:two-component system sensor histidine kinase AtoS